MYYIPIIPICQLGFESFLYFFTKDAAKPRKYWVYGCFYFSKMTKKDLLQTFFRPKKVFFVSPTYQVCFIFYLIF